MDWNILAGCKVLVCGDSISEGIVYDEAAQKYVKAKENFVCMAQTHLNCAVTNISRFGNTIATALPRLSKRMGKERPDVVLIELGGNDCDFNWEQVAETPGGEHLPVTDIGVFSEALQRLAASLKGQHVLPVFATLPPLDADRYFQWISHNSAEKAARILQWLGSVTRIYWWHERYNAAVLEVAEKTGAALLDLRSAFLKTADFRRYICADGIHPNREGQILIGREVERFLSEKCPALLNGHIGPAQP